MNTETNPFDAAYLGLEIADEPSTVRVSVRIPHRWMEMAVQFAQDSRLPFNRSASAVIRAGLIRYLQELAATFGESEMHTYLEAMGRLRHSAFKRHVEAESRRYLLAFETGLIEAERKRRWAVVNETLSEIRGMVDRARSDEWRSDLLTLVAGNEPIKRAARSLIEAWNDSGVEANRLQAQEWWRWLQHLEEVLYG